MPINKPQSQFDALREFYFNYDYRRSGPVDVLHVLAMALQHWDMYSKPAPGTIEVVRRARAEIVTLREKLMQARISEVPEVVLAEIRRLMRNETLEEAAQYCEWKGQAEIATALRQRKYDRDPPEVE